MLGWFIGLFIVTLPFILDLNPDVAQSVARGKYTSGIEHYLKYGFNENRKINK